MSSRISLAVVLGCLVMVEQSSAATVTHNGIPYFDTSLGTLTHVTVTIDPVPRDTLGGPTQFPWPHGPIPEHEHLVTFPSFSVMNREFVFQPVATSTASGLENIFHTHSYDPPAVVEIFEGADIDPFIPSGFSIPIGGYFLLGSPTTEAHGHSHDIGQIGINFNTEAVTVFEYIPFGVPEPSTFVLLTILAALTAVRRRSR